MKHNAYVFCKKRLRRGRDSNPRTGFPVNTLAVCCIRPLCHLSVCCSIQIQKENVTLSDDAPARPHKVWTSVDHSSIADRLWSSMVSSTARGGTCALEVLHVNADLALCRGREEVWPAGHKIFLKF